MPIYKYKGYDLKGNLIQSTIEVDSERNAQNILKEKQILVSQIKEYTKSSIFRFKSKSNLCNITRSLGVLLTAGVQLKDSLDALSSDQSSYWNNLISKLKSRISEGSSLARAMADFKDDFPEYYINMVASGEESGRLSDVFTRLADFLESENSLKAKIKTAMIYPLIMIGTSIIIVLCLMMFVIPKIAKVFEASKVSLPIITKILIETSNFIWNYWFIIMGIFILLGYIFRWFINNKRLNVDKIIIRLPSKSIKSLYIARFSRTLGLLLQSGNSIIKALDLASLSVGNKAFQYNIKQAIEDVISGASLSVALKGLPSTFIQIIKSSEKAGNLAEGLRRAAAIYEEDFNRRADRIVSFFEPIMILVMGTVVGFIVFSIMLPLLRMEQLVR